MENNETSQRKISTPQAIIIAGVLIMLGILLTRGRADIPVSKTLSEQVGVSKEQLTACIKGADLEGLYARISTSVDKAMSGVPREERGTPYNIVIGPNGFRTDVRGAMSYENMSKVISAAREGKLAEVTTDSGTVTLTEPYTGDITLKEESDHIRGNANASVTVIEYSDFECPYCKQFQPVMERIVTESNGNVAWVYRNYPLHQHSFEKLVAAECVAKIKGNDAYWKYADLLFGMLKTGDESVSEQL
ncbi:MAG: thioredoxin domain-containing protein [Patescibacteria group bacterium]